MMLILRHTLVKWIQAITHHTPTHTIGQSTTNPIIIVMPITNHLTVLVDPTIRMNPSMFVSPQTGKVLSPPISPITITDLISPHHLITFLTILVGPIMNLTSILSPTSMADSTKMDITITEGTVELAKLCPTSPLLSHTAKGMLPTMGNPIIVLRPTILVNPIIKATVTAGFTILNPNTTEDSLFMQGTFPSTPLRGPSTRKDLTSIAAIMEATKLTMASIPTTESTIATENTVMESILTTESMGSILTTENIPIIAIRASPNSLPHSSPTAPLASPLLLWEPKARSIACLSRTLQLGLMPLVFPAKSTPRTTPKNQTPGVGMNKFRSAKVSLSWACDPDSYSIAQIPADLAQTLTWLSTHQEAQFSPAVAFHQPCSPLAAHCPALCSLSCTILKATQCSCILSLLYSWHVHVLTIEALIKCGYLVFLGPWQYREESRTVAAVTGSKARGGYNQGQLMTEAYHLVYQEFASVGSVLMCLTM